jgi:long-chain fatty acid transport protein
MGRVVRTVIGAACFTVAMAGPASAGGIWFYEQSTPDQGTAAGRAAMARDAPTAYGNPAGMSRLDTQFLVGAGALVVQSQFETEAGTNVGGGGASLTSALPILSGFYVYNLSRDWKIGVAANSLMGLAAEYAIGLNLSTRF